VKITSLEGNRHALDGGSMFGHVPKALWSRWIKSDENNRAELASRALLIEDDKGDLYLFDGTIGTSLPPKERERYCVVGEENQLLLSLASNGVKPKDIRGIVLSHLHFDHVGGVLNRDEKGLSLLFPHATHYISVSHFERAKAPKPRDRASFISDLPPLLESSGKLKLLQKDDRLPFPSELFLSEGHTLGLLIVMLYAPGLIALPTDLIPGVPWINLPVNTGFDRFPEQSVIEKEALLKRVVKEDGLLFLTHDPLQAFIGISFENSRFSQK
jgi:glyoxylase-like metal-dependent hydrolase (beta-lactamase superfamily II)